MAYKDINKQRAANKEAAKRYRDTKQGMTVNKPKGMTKEGMTQGMSDRPEYLIDACGTRHKKDYDTRQEMRKLLESWADGKGTEYQRRMGMLAGLVPDWMKAIG